jgi:hypothetical protein
MKNATIHHAELMNEFEMIQVSHHMEQTNPDVLYTMTPGNDCIWVYYGQLNLYYIFRNGKIAEIQVD